MAVSEALAQQLRQAFQDYGNPFDNLWAISGTEIWDHNDIPQVESINKVVVDDALKLIAKVRSQRSQKETLFISAGPGLGKSHVIRRVWKTLEDADSAFFTYIPPCSHALAEYHVRFHICEDLNRFSKNKVTQWQRLAAGAIRSLQNTEHEEEFEDLIELCDNPNLLAKYIKQSISRDQYVNFFCELAEAILDVHGDLDFDFIKATLFMIFKSAPISHISLSWLKGDDHPEIKNISLPLYGRQEERARDVKIVKQLSHLASLLNKPTVLCFDQLDSWEANEANGHSASQTTAVCVDRLYLECSNIVFLVCGLQDHVREIGELGSGIPDRFLKTVKKLQVPTAAELIELAQVRLGSFIKKFNLQGAKYPPLYPLTKEGIENVAREQVTIRQFFKLYCVPQIEQFIVSAPPLQPIVDVTLDPFPELYNQVLSQFHKSAHFTDDETAAIIFHCFKYFELVTNKNVNGVDVIAVHKAAGLISGNNDLHFVVEAYDRKKKQKMRIGVRVCETQNGTSFSTAMRNLIKYRAYSLSRGCLIRSTPIPTGWRKGNELIDELTKRKGGELIISDISKVGWYKEAFKGLLALYTLTRNSDDYDYIEEELLNFLNTSQVLNQNGLIDEILSAPE